MKPRLVIIGFGSFGQYMVRHLRRAFEIVAIDERDISADCQRLGVTRGDYSSLAAAKVIIAGVPVQGLETLAAKFAELGEALEGKVIVDVCSVKVVPGEILIPKLPKSAHFMSLHPLFGPVSAPHSIEGRLTVMCPGRVSDRVYQRVRRFLMRSMHLTVVECDAHEHDQTMAYVQVLTHLIGRALKEVGLPDTALATTAYARMREMMNVLTLDSWPLFVTIAKHNPYSKDVRSRLQTAFDRLNAAIDG